MISRAQELCRKLRPVMGKRIDGLWAAYVADDADGRADIERTLELLAAKHLGLTFEPDRSPFPPPAGTFARSGDVPVGTVMYSGRRLYPFLLKCDRLKEHVLVAGRSGSGKTNLGFVLMQGIMEQGVKVLALDWKRGYRDLLELRKDLRIYTVGRDVSPFRFNPLIPPPGCEPHVWIKLIVDAIASAYFGGEGVISLLVAGLDKLYTDAGVFDGTPRSWPMVQDLLAWLRGVNLKGRAALWQASAERILLGMTYGEFGAVLNARDNGHVVSLLDQNVILEMDGLSAASDRKMFSEALTLYLYRYRLAQGPKRKLTNLIILEEAHNLLLKKASDAKESALESSIRMIRQYGLGYVFVDQSASLLSQVAFANSYATIALSQKLRGDIQALSAAMNLTEEQRDALSTLPVGTAVVRVADEHPEAFLVRIPRSPVREGAVSDTAVRSHMATYFGRSTVQQPAPAGKKAVPVVPPPDRRHTIRETHPPSPKESRMTADTPAASGDSRTSPPKRTLSREALRFLADVAGRPLSATVPRYQRLHLSRRRGNAIRASLLSAGLIEGVAIATRSGQVVLCQLTALGRSLCQSSGIDPGPPSRESLEHRYWVRKTARHFEGKGFEVQREHPVKGNGAVDILAERPGKRVAVEVETGKSDIGTNLAKVQRGGFDRIVLVATSPAALGACQRACQARDEGAVPPVETLTWLDVS